MPIYEYVCPRGHKSERIVIKVTPEEPLESTPCNVGKCRSGFVIATLVPSETGKPILKAGCGGFYKPNAR